MIVQTLIDHHHSSSTTMDSTLISKWVNDVHCLFQLENDLDLPYLLEVEKDNTFVLKQLSEYDVQKVARVYKFEAFAVQYKSLAKQFIQVIKPTLPVAWFGYGFPMNPSLENAFLDLSAKKVLFDRIVRVFNEIWAADKKNWSPSGFCENTWMELNNLKI